MIDVEALPHYTVGVDPVPACDRGWVWAWSLWWQTNYWAPLFPVPAKRSKRVYVR